MYIYFCVIVIQPINIHEQERQGMFFTTTTRAKYLNGLRFQFSFSYNRYENIKKLKRVVIIIVEENILRLITMKTICNMSTFLLFTFSIFQHYYYHFAFSVGGDF